MIIDARNAVDHGPYRAYTVKQAVAQALEKIDVGSFADIEAFRDAVGADLPKPRLDTLVNTTAGDRKFSVRKQEGMVARIYRIA